MANVLIAGCGYVGTPLATRLEQDGHSVWALRRSSRSVGPRVHTWSADLRTIAELPAHFDYVVYSASPDERTEGAYRAVYIDGLRNLLDRLQESSPPKRLLFTSSTAVYGQSRGEWVDEESETAPDSFSGKTLLEAERLLAQTPIETVVVRFGGIYGPGRTSLIARVLAGTATCSDETPQFTNRIHRDDCVGALRHLLMHDTPASVYLGVDHEPADGCDVLTWLAKKLSVPPPGRSPDSKTNERRTRGSKRCRNDRLASTGYRFIYPTFREGYGSLLQERT